MNVKMRYVTARPSKSNPKRWYWQRPGYPLTRLPDDPARRWAMVERLNAQADKTDAEEAAQGSVSWCVEKYKASEQFQKRAAETRRIYERWCDEFVAMWGQQPIQTISRRVVVEFANSLRDSPSTRGQAISVLSKLFEVARYYGLQADNPCHRLGLSSGKPRDRYMLPEDEAKMFPLADERMRRTLYLLLYTAQRPGDVLAMTRSQWNGDTIRVRQEKTRKLVEIPCHRTLRAVLAEAPKDSLLLAGWRGNAESRYAAFNDAFRALRKAAGIEDLQARDLRRTAVVRLTEAGCTVQEVAAISGHSIERAQRIIDTYYTRTLQVARNAIAKWEAAEESNVPGR